MPEETIRAFQDHGRVELTLESHLEEAQHLFSQLYAAGVDYEDVVATLEREGIEKFVASFDRLLREIDAKRRDLAAAASGSAVPPAARRSSSQANHSHERELRCAAGNTPRVGATPAGLMLFPLGEDPGLAVALRRP